MDALRFGTSNWVTRVYLCFSVMFSDQNSAVRAFETPWTTWPAHDRKILPTDVGKNNHGEKISCCGLVDTAKDKVQNISFVCVS